MLLLTNDSWETPFSFKNQFEFLVTMAGNPTYLKGNDGKSTYARVYEPFGPYDRRKSISEIGYIVSSRCKDIGEKYGSPQGWKTDFRGTTMQASGFFRTVKTFDDEDPEQFLNCFAYALGTFGTALEELAEKKMEKIQDSVSERINHIVNTYFTNVTNPKDGDLAIYSVEPGKVVYTPNSVEISGTTHAGIYRKKVSNGGTIESKWGWCAQPHVFEHEVFFTPDFYGDIVKFYRIKKLN